MIFKFKLLLPSVFPILLASLISGCSVHPTRSAGSRSGCSGAAPSSYSSPIASFGAVSWQNLLGWQEDDMT